MDRITTNAAPQAIGPYSQAIVINSMLYTSGQIPVDPLTQLVSGDGIEDQAELVFKNLEAIFHEAGTDLNKTVKTTCFLADMSDFETFNAVYSRYFVSKPARSCIAVKALPKGVLVEVEAIAVL